MNLQRWVRFTSRVLLLSLLVFLSSWQQAPTALGAFGSSLKEPQALDAEPSPGIQKAAAMGSQRYGEQEPIRITKNAEFAAYGFPGEGTEESPYAIAGLNITGAAETLITIQDTTAYFRIRDNYLTGSYGYHGILLENVTHGAVEANVILQCMGIVLRNSGQNTVSNNTLSACESGIILSGTGHSTVTDNTIANSVPHGLGMLLAYGSSHNTVIRNTIANCDEAGIRVGAGWAAEESSTNNTLVDNTVFKNGMGIYLWYSGQHTLADNTVSNNRAAGIRLVHSRQNTIVGNRLVNNGLVISGEDIESYSQAIVANNRINNRPLVYWMHVRGEIVPPGAGQVILINTTGVEVSRQILSNVSNGVLTILSTHVAIHHNILSNNVQGITLIATQNTNISYNTIISCYQGITLDSDSKHNTIAHNAIFANRGVGISLGFTEQNNISYNAVAHNHNGIELFGDCKDNNISYNTIAHNQEGLSLIQIVQIRDGSFWPVNNTVQENNFLGNQLKQSYWNESHPGSQAYDGGENTIFIRNYWDNHENTDLNEDGIADTPYIIAAANSPDNQDPTPLVAFATPHRLSTPTPIYPPGGETVQSTVLLHWMAAFDTWGHSVTYNVSYSADDGHTWILLATGLTYPSYEWDTTNVVDGGSYRIQVVAASADGFTAEDCSDASFSIQNQVLTTTSLPATTTTSPPATTATSPPPVEAFPNMGGPVVILFATLWLIIIPIIRVKRNAVCSEYS